MYVCQDPLSHDFLINVFLQLLKKKGMAVYKTKSAYSDTIEGIKINRVLPVNLEL